MNPVVTYVASPDLGLNLYLSIHTLFKSESDVDHVKIFSVGGDMPNIKSLSTPIEVEKVKSKNNNTF